MVIDQLTQDMPDHDMDFLNSCRLSVRNIDMVLNAGAELASIAPGEPDGNQTHLLCHIHSQAHTR